MNNARPVRQARRAFQTVDLRLVYDCLSIGTLSLRHAGDVHSTPDSIRRSEHARGARRGVARVAVAERSGGAARRYILQENNNKRHSQINRSRCL